MDTPHQDATRYNPAKKAQAKTARIPIKMVPAETLKKPDWIRVKAGSPEHALLRDQADPARAQAAHRVRGLLCPNIGECFGHGTATFMIMGDKCNAALPVLRRRPRPARSAGRGRSREPRQDHRRAEAEVRGDHQRRPRRPARRRRRPFRRVHPRTRELSPATRIEILTPDFRGRDDRALEILKAAPPDVMNHNLETIPRLTQGSAARLDHAFSLNLLKRFRRLRAGRAHQERPDGRPRRDRRGDPAGDARHARAQHRHADHRPVPRALRPPPAGAPLRAPRTPSDVSRPKRRRWASATPPSARWCAPATTPTVQAHGVLEPGRMNIRCSRAATGLHGSHSHAFPDPSARRHPEVAVGVASALARATAVWCRRAMPLT